MEKNICPKCTSEDIKKGALGASFGQVHIYPETKRGTSSSISGEFCKDCGYVLSFYVDEPNRVE